MNTRLIFTMAYTYVVTIDLINTISKYYSSFFEIYMQSSCKYAILQIRVATFQFNNFHIYYASVASRLT